MADPAELIDRLKALVVGTEALECTHVQISTEDVYALLAALTPTPSAEDAAVLASRLTITPKILRDAATTLADSKGDYEVAYVNAMARKQRTADMALREHWKHIEDFFWWVGEPARTEAAKPSKYDPSLDTVEHIAGLVAEGEHDKAVACLARMAGKVPTPPGYKLVPVEATEAMEAAMSEAIVNDDPIALVWTAAIEAAPESPR